MSLDAYGHLVEIDEKQRMLAIYRVNDGERHLYTSVRLPDGKWRENPEVFAQFCRTFGENILMDSPQARRLLDI